MVEISTALTAVNVLFGLFVGMQVRWLFGGASVVNETTGLSVAAYARSGFFELVTVSALVLPLLLGTRVGPKGFHRFKTHEEFEAWKMSHRLKPHDSQSRTILSGSAVS